jgi:hypothetical protein
MNDMGCCANHLLFTYRSLRSRCRLQRIVTARWPLSSMSSGPVLCHALGFGDLRFSHMTSGPFHVVNIRRDHSRADNCEPHVRFYVIHRQTTIAVHLGQ